VTDDQLRWLADLLLEGAPLNEVEQKLRNLGHSEVEALNAIESILSSPIFAAARPKVQLGQRLAAAADLHQHVCRGDGSVPRRNGLSAEQFYQEWLCHHQPVVIDGFAKTWGALDWTVSELTDRFGDAPIEVLSGRDQAAHPDRDFRQLTRQIHPKEWEQILSANEASNDDYLVARNHLMQGSIGRNLIQDTPISSQWVRQDNLLDCCSLWMGPKGTFTAAHHDTCHALFVQLVGEKTFDLASPLIVETLIDLEPYYHGQRNLKAVCETEQLSSATLKPGDALFLPVGWWHQATALSLSVGMSFNGLHAPNDYGEYCPGRI
jgi:hypothetical protein